MLVVLASTRALRHAPGAQLLPRSLRGSSAQVCLPLLPAGVGVPNVRETAELESQHVNKETVSQRHVTDARTNFKQT